MRILTPTLQWIARRLRSSVCIIRNGGHEMYLVRNNSHVRQQCVFCRYETTGWKLESTTYRIVDTDNFNGDYPNEKFVESQFYSKTAAQRFADEMNKKNGPNAPRYYKVVEMPYTLQPGFEP